MSLRSLLAARILRAPTVALDPQLPRVVSTIVDGQVAPARAVDLQENERRAVDLLVRTHVERAGHFDAPRFS